MSADPFRHHPGLRGLVTPRAESFFADFTPDKVRDLMRNKGLDTSWTLPEAEREADRAATLAGRDGDLWVFAYGSLMWDPGVAFAELRRAHAPGVARRFILYDDRGGRGSPEAPGVLAALDTGDGCDGLVFRIAAADVPRESYSLWSRERIGPAYRSVFLPVETAQGQVQALAFLADHEAEMIRPDLSHADQVRLLATGHGILGTARAYLENLAAHFAQMGIDAPEVARLMRDVAAHDVR